MFRNWIRVKDTAGNQFDLAEDDNWPEGVTRVPDYPVYIGAFGRPGKANVPKAGNKKTSDIASGTGEQTTKDAEDLGKDKE